jgi:type I restriction enzyme, S subunit
VVMSGEWPTVQLGTLTADHDGAVAIGPFGSAMKAEEYASHGVPIIRGTNVGASRELKGDWVFIPEAFADAMPRCVVRPGDLVFPHRGAIGEVALVPEDRDRYFMSTSFMKATLDLAKADPRFVMYYLKSDAGRAEIMRFASQVGTPGIGQPLTSLRQFVVPCPPLRMQKCIADLLWTLDDKIELNRRMAATLEEMARALFKSWFVDFDPVRAKAEGRDPGLPAATAALFPDTFGEDGLPVGWSTGTLADVSLLNPESRGSVSEGEIIYVDLANTKWGVIEATQHFTPDDAPSRAQRILRSGDTIVGTVRPGNGSYALIASDNLIGSTGFAVLRPKTPSLREFVYLAATSGENIEALTALADGGAYPAVRPDVVADTPGCLPPEQVLGAFHAVTVDLMDRIEAARSQSAALGTLRDTLLPKLISGELRIEDAHSAVEAA